MKKIYNTVIVPYYDIQESSDYISYLKKCKARELSIRFLEEIGISIQNIKNRNYAKPFDEEITFILDSFINSNCGFSENVDNLLHFELLKGNNNLPPQKSLENKLKIINLLLCEKHETITKENFEVFSKSTEYSNLLQIINKFNEIHEKLWASRLKPI